ncbi:MarR family transcriptional regulator [Sphingobium sp. H39-3-25]|uniref:MarR family winged helix-turn-helix transcriptional regulator n=1 Tax=Sphingobium arseniciresistens TaxID=3030834 RepID=UPI0023B9DF85|nr:MarR family transcriptional regulator [Sphingobium arseniciresistens]
MKKEARPKKSVMKSPALDASIGFLLRKAYQRNMVLFGQLSSDPDLTAVQAAALLALKDHSPCSLAELGRTAAMDPATTRGVVERMRKRKLVRTEPSLEDKRELRIVLEKEGRKIAETVGETGKTITEATLAPLNDAERVALDYLLRKICGE